MTENKFYPKELKNACRGLAFWIGYRRSIYNLYHIPEAAVVTEFCNLLSAHLGNDKFLFPEQMYKKLTDQPDIRQIRCDVAVFRKIEKVKLEDRAPEQVEYVVEVKRYDSSDNAIQEDIRRLGTYLASKPDPKPQAFLVISCEGTIPEEYSQSIQKKVDDTFGIIKLDAKRGTQTTNDGNTYSVRQLAKALSSENIKVNETHSVVVIEVHS